MTNWMFAEAVDDACDHFLDPAGCLDCLAEAAAKAAAMKSEES